MISTARHTKKLLLTVIFSLSFLALPLSTSAQSDVDFEINTDYKIIYEPESDFVEIEEKVHLKVNNQKYYFPAKEERIFTLPDFSLQTDEDERAFKIESVKIYDENGYELTPTINQTDVGVELSVPDRREITYWNDEEITITYKTHELVNQNGNITNLYIPGLPEDTEFYSTDSKYDLVTQYTFDTTLEVPENAPEASYIYPQGSLTESTNGGSRVYRISQEDRAGETAWIQLGTEQYYYFKMVQPTPKTDTIIPTQLSKYSDFISTNIYQLPLPKENPETNQKVFFNKIEPTPTRVEVDSEGNYIATFEVPANEAGEIVVEGYIVLDNSNSTDKIRDIPLNQYDSEIEFNGTLLKYLLPDAYWETNSDLVQETSSELYGNTSTILELIEKDYNYVIDTLDYSYEKVEGNNERLGALAALQGGQAVCMEYSDSLIAIMRAQGLPSRAAIGYGNDPTGAENVIGTEEALQQNIGHQWMQVWIPEYGWLSVDPTWGESGREYIGPNLDHILWYTVGDSEQGYVGTSLSTADPVSQAVLSSYDVYLQALPRSDFDQITSLSTLGEITNQFQGEEADELSTFLKTTSVGKIAVIVTPILIVLFLLYMILSTSIAVFKGVRTNLKKKPKEKEFKDEFKM